MCGSTNYPRIVNTRDRAVQKERCEGEIPGWRVPVGATGSASENYHLRLLTSSPQRRQKPSLPVRHTGNVALHWRSQWHPI